MSLEASLSLKERGDLAFNAGLFHDAIRFYSEAIESAPNSSVLYSNRSAAYSSLRLFPEALADSEKCIKLRPDWARGYTRKGLALFYMGSLEEAVDCYSQGLAVEPANPQIQEALSTLTSILDQQQHPFSCLLKDANIVKLMTHSRTAGFFRTQDFHDMLNAIRANPDRVSEYAKDPRLTEVVSVLLGSGDCGESGDSTDEGARLVDPAREAAEAEKELGNVAYKQKRFGDALEHYETAHELDPSNVTYVTNMSAVYFEKQDYVKCVEKCQEAISIGRESGSTSHQLSKAMTRRGDALLKLGQIDAGIEAFNQSLFEHSDETVKRKIITATKLKEQADTEARTKTDGEAANSEGNALFAKRKYRKAADVYTQAVDLNPAEGKYLLNRSACYLKLHDFDSALSDVQQCLQLDPKSAKGMFRKAVVLAHMRRHDEAEQVMREIEAIEGPEAEDMRRQIDKFMREVEEKKPSRAEK